jgi:hypothetical protein
MADHQHHQYSLNTNQQQHHEAVKRVPSPLLAERYLAAIQTNNIGSSNSNGNGNKISTSSSSNINSNININNASMKRPRPSNHKINIGNRPPPPPPQSTSSASISISALTSTSTSSGPQDQHEANYGHAQDGVFSNDDFGNETTGVNTDNTSLNAALIQSRNGSTSPSRVRMVRSESYTRRDPASFNEQERQHPMQQQGDDEDGHNQIQNQKSTFRRQWTPNQWRNLRTAQLEEHATGNQQQQHLKLNNQESNSNRIRCDSKNSTGTNNSNSHGSRTETDIVNNKVFDLKRQNSSFGLKSSTSTSTSNTPWGSVLKSQNNSNRKLQNQQQQYNNDDEGECDFLASEETCEPNKPLHHQSTGTTGSMTMSAPMSTPMSMSKKVNRNDTSSPTPLPIPVSPTVLTARKWQKKVLNDRGWIKNGNRNTNIGNRNFGEQSQSQTQSSRLSNKRNDNDGTATSTSTRTNTNEKLDFDSSSLASLTEQKVQNNKNNRIRVKEKHQQHQNTLESSIQKLDSNLLSPSRPQQEVRNFANTTKLPPSSPCISTESIPIKKITSMWMNRVSATSDRNKSSGNGNSEKISKQKELPENDCEIAPLSQPQPQHQKSAYPINQIQNTNMLETAKVVDEDSNGEKHIWKNVKLRRVKDENQKKDAEKIERGDKSDTNVIKVVDDSTVDSVNVRSIDDMIITEREQGPSVAISVTERIKRLSGNNFVATKVQLKQRRQVTPLIEEITPKAINGASRTKKSKVLSTDNLEVGSFSLNGDSYDEVQQAPSRIEPKEITLQKESHSSINNDQGKTTIASEESEYQSVRSRLRSWSTRKRVETCDQYQPIRSSTPIRSTPIRSLQVDAQQYAENGTSREVTDSAIQGIPPKSDSLALKKGSDFFSDKRPSTLRPYQIEKNKLRTFLKDPSQEVATPDQNSIAKNITSSPSNSLRQNQLKEHRNRFVTSDIDSNLIVTKTSKPVSGERTDCKLNSYDDEVIDEKSPLKNISFEFTSVKQRIRSLAGEIDTVVNANEKDTNEDENIASKGALVSGQQKKVAVFPIDTKKNSQNDTILKPTGSKFNFSHQKKGTHSFKAQSQLPQKKAPPTKNNNDDDDDDETPSRCVGVAINNDIVTGESKGVRNIKSLFENGNTNSPPPCTKKTSSKKWNKRDQNEERFTSQQSKPTIHESTEDRKCVTNSDTKDQNCNKVSRSTNKISNVVSIRSKFEFSSLPKSTEECANQKSCVDNQSNRLESPVFPKSRISNDMRGDTHYKDEAVDGSRIQSIAKKGVFTSIRSKFESSGQQSETSPVKRNLEETTKKDSSLNYVNSVQPDSRDLVGPPVLQKKNLSGDIGNGFRSIEMFHDNRSKSISPFSDIDVQQKNDSSPKDDVQFDRNLQTPPNDIPWSGQQAWSSAEQKNTKCGDKKVHIDMNNEIVNCSYDSYNDDEDCDGVTLSPTTSDVSELSIPTCLQSVEMSTEFESSSSSDEDTGAMESCTDKQSSAIGASEASSSHTSEAATPLIHSTLRTMNLKMGRLTSHSDSTQSIDVKQVTNLLGTIPPLKEDSSYEEGLLLPDSQIASQSSLNNGCTDRQIANTCEDADFSPAWEADFFDNNSDDSSQAHEWEAFTGYNDKLGSLREPFSKHHTAAPRKSSHDEPEPDAVDSTSVASNLSSTSSRVYRLRQGIRTKPNRLSEVENRGKVVKVVKETVITNCPTEHQPKRSANNIEKVKVRSLSLKDNNSSIVQSKEVHTNQDDAIIQSTSSDRENKAPVVIKKHIFKTTANLKVSTTKLTRSSTSTRRFDISKVKAYQLARRKSYDRHKHGSAK